MSQPTSSIARWLGYIALAAVDCSLLRRIFGNTESVEILAISGVFVMTNWLCLGLIRLVFKGWRARPFLVGFEVAGALAVLGYLAALWLSPFLTLMVVSGISRPLENWCDRHLLSWLEGPSVGWNNARSKLALPLGIFSFGLSPTALQFGLAVFGGLIARDLLGPKTWEDPGRPGPRKFV